jgi:hypothetical protein
MDSSHCSVLLVSPETLHPSAAVLLVSPETLHASAAVLLVSPFMPVLFVCVGLTLRHHACTHMQHEHLHHLWCRPYHPTSGNAQHRVAPSSGVDLSNDYYDYVLLPCVGTGPNATLPYNGTVARPGINVSPLCPNDVLVANNTNCTVDPVKSYGKYPMPTSGPCIITIAQPKCDGVSKKCIGSRPAGIGTPCDSDGGLYSEAYTEDGKLATVASVSSEHAEKHGWEKCKRCYNGKCRTFKWEWWKTVKEHHHKRDRE